MAKTIAEIRAEAFAHYDGKNGFDNSNRRNAYVCEGESGFGVTVEPCEPCGSFIVTVDREPGVTPAFIRCGNCNGQAGSKFYRIADWLEPTHEWYRPETLDGLSDGEIDHVERCGLLLRQIGGGLAGEGWKHQDTSPVDYSRCHRHEEIMAINAEIERKLLELEKPPLDRSAYPNRQQYRAAVREQRKGRA